jgi:hypothetical protein
MSHNQVRNQNQPNQPNPITNHKSQITNHTKDEKNRKQKAKKEDTNKIENTK